MHVFSRMLLSAGILAAIYGCLGVIIPGWSGGLLPERPWRVLDRTQTFSEAERSARLERASWLVRTRLQSKDGIVRALCAGRFTLFEAAARFRELDRNRPTPYLTPFRAVSSSHTEAERYCREVIAWTEALLATPGKPTALVGRLQADLQKAIDHGDLHWMGEEV